MIYIAAVGFISVVPQVFFPEFDPEMAPAGPCPEAYATLREELVEAAADHVGRENPDALAPLLDRWDDRYAALRDRYGGDLVLESNEPKGLAATIRLPL